MFEDLIPSNLSQPETVESNQAPSRPRFSLRKRVVKNDKDMVNLSSYNSDFLTGLFEDVAKANVQTDDSSDHGIQQKRSSAQISADGDVEMLASPPKKIRSSLTRCLSRVGASSMNLSAMVPPSPQGINELFGPSRRRASFTKRFQQNQHHDSLAFQLNCVSGSDDSGIMSASPTSDVGDVPKLAFPNLPATVSDSSCDKGLTRAKLVRHVSNRENDTKESFGWFVDLDDHQSPEAQTGLPYVVSSTDLAFQAPTAPKRTNDDAEVEWAKAADTVDDVLGDFF